MGRAWTIFDDCYTGQDEDEYDWEPHQAKVFPPSWEPTERDLAAFLYWWDPTNSYFGFNKTALKKN